MGDTYDEDLEKNPFFESLRSKAPNLFRDVLAQKLYILVPKRESLKTLARTDPVQIFKRHIVRLEERSNGEIAYWNLEGHALTTSDDGQLLTLGISEGDHRRQSVSVRILFEETYFTDDGASCKLICISRPLISVSDDISEQLRLNFSLDMSSTSAVTTPSPASPYLDGSPASTSLSDPFQYYERVLFHDDYENSVQRRIRKNLTRFSERMANEYRSGWHFQQLKSLVREEFYATLRDILSRKRASDEKFDDNGISQLQISTEIFLYRCVHTNLLNLICACVRDEESALNRMKHEASELVPSDWGIAPELYGDLPSARKQLTKLNEIDNPYGKLLCLRKIIASLASSTRFSNGRRVPISTDELIPPLAFLIVKSNIFNWVTNILYITEFHFSEFANDELGYCLASFEAAAQFIKDGSMKPVVIARWRDWALGKALNNNQEKDVIADISEKEEEDPNVATTDYWECMIAALQSNDEAAVRDCMHAANVEPDQDQSNGGFLEDPNSLPRKCHPLCECPECLRNRQTRRITKQDSINYLTAQGFTALHFAALFGQTSMLHYLIRSGGKAILDKADDHGRTPLHWACRIGSQSCTLLLLHHEAHSNPVDISGNTPLHLASYYGHVDCVKALLYFNQQVRGSSAQVNSMNHVGDSALHIAVRYHYVDVVSVLLECGANAKLRDKKGKTAFDLCEDFETRRLLTQVSPFVEVPVVDAQNQTKVSVSSSGSQIENSASVSVSAGHDDSTFSVSSTSTLLDLNIEKIDKLLKAVADDDLPMVKYYLGGSLGCTEKQSGRCHPLCQCPKCEDFDDEVEDKINVNATGSNGLGALHTAVIYNRVEILRYLLQSCGSDVNWPSAADARTCLHLAVLTGNLQIIELLSEYKADISARDSSGDTPVHLISLTENIPVMLFLVSKFGPECTNVTNSDGDTVLHKGVKENQTSLVSALLEVGASSTVQNRDHLTPLDCAVTDDMKAEFRKG